MSWFNKLATPLTIYYKTLFALGMILKLCNCYHCVYHTHSKVQFLPSLPKANFVIAEHKGKQLNTGSHSS